MSESQSTLAPESPDIPLLTPQQVLALEALYTGKSVPEAANAAGVSRATVYRWLKTDTNVRAAHNRWLDEMRQTCQGRLLMLAARATGALAVGLAKGDPKIAIALLKGLGLLRPASVGPIDSASLQRLDIITARKQEQKLAQLEDKYGSYQDDIWPPFSQDTPPKSPSEI